MKTTPLVFTFLWAMSFICHAQDDQLAKVDETINAQEIEDQIYFLASDQMQGRKIGTPQIDQAATYIAEKLTEYGAQPVEGNKDLYQNIDFERVTAADKLTVTLEGQSYKQVSAFESSDTKLSASAVYIGFGSTDDFEKTDVKGKVVVVKAGSADAQDFRSSFFSGRNKRQLAATQGALALIEIINLDDQSWGFIQNYNGGEKISLATDDPSSDFNHIWIRSDQEVVWTTGQAMQISLEVQGVRKEQFQSKNVVAMIPGTDPELKDQYMIYSAHYDHVGVKSGTQEADTIFNGARDNAVGVVTVLSVAKNLGKHPTKRSALFILFTAEENGLLGSQYYVEHPLIPLNQMVFCFNSDNGGYNDTSLTTIIGLERTTAANHIKTAAQMTGLKATDDPAPEQNLFDRSDNVHFARAGIPAPTYSLGFTAFDAEIAKYYHQVTDNPDNLDYPYLVKFFRSYVLSSRLIADDPHTPFWVEGDKYFPAGKALYSGE